MREVEFEERIENSRDNDIYYYKKSDRIGPDQKWVVEGFDSWSREAKDAYARAHLQKKWNKRHR